jgi:hypothetical protein
LLVIGVERGRKELLRRTQSGGEIVATEGETVVRGGKETRGSEELFLLVEWGAAIWGVVLTHAQNEGQGGERSQKKGKMGKEVEKRERTEILSVREERS